MTRPSRRTLLFLAALVLAVGVVGVRALRTTTTEISRAEAASSSTFLVRIANDAVVQET